MPTYEVTYSFGGYFPGTPSEAIERSFAALDELRARDVEIDHLGSTVTIDADGAVTDVTARYDARSEGHVGWLTVAALLPVSGIRRLDPRAASETDRGSVRAPA